MHVGLIDSAPCESCHHDKTIAKIRGCSGKSAPRPVLEDEHDGKIIIYWSCPARFIPKSVSHWNDMYTYQKEFPGADMPGWGKQTAKWIKFYKVYKSELSKFKRQQERLSGS